MFYGGKLLSHLPMTEDDEISEFIRLLRINPKCAVVIDSDRSSAKTRIRGTKRRIRSEAISHSLFCWVTQGREMENYISPKYWSENFNVTQRDTGQYSKVFDVLKGKKTPEDKAVNTKIELAAFIDENITKDDLVLDWEDRTRELIEKIRDANS